jgi:hypothetical protein
MRLGKHQFDLKPGSFRRRSVLLLMLTAVNVSGCNNGQIRNVQRPRFLSNPFRRPAIVVNPGLEAVETPGSVVVEQQGSIPANSAINRAEPPATQLEARPGGTVTNVVPSFDDVRPASTEPSSKYNNSISGGISGKRSDSTSASPAPAVEAPNVIMDNPPIGGSDRTPTTNPPLDSSPSQGSGSGSGKAEPRLEFLEPRRPGQSGSGSSSTLPNDKTGGSTAPGTKPSAWRTPKFGDVSGRTTYQTSNRGAATESQYGDSTPPRLGVLD